MKNYRLTQRGKIVFTGLFIALIIALVSMVSYLNKQIDSAGEGLMVNTAESEINNENVEDFDSLNKDKSESNNDKFSGTPTSSQIDVKVDTVVDLTGNTLVRDASEDAELAQSSNDRTYEDTNKLLDDRFGRVYTIYYSPDNCEVDEKSSSILDEYYELAIENESGIIIEGNYHSGKNYDEKMFAHLSKNRALSAKEYLMNKGIVESRITIIDNRNSKPLNKDGSDLEVVFNRRVDIYFEDIDMQVDE